MALGKRFYFLICSFDATPAALNVSMTGAFSQCVRTSLTRYRPVETSGQANQ